MRRLEVVVGCDELGAQRLDGEVEIIVGRLQRRDALRPQVKLVLRCQSRPAQ